MWTASIFSLSCFQVCNGTNLTLIFFRPPLPPFLSLSPRLNSICRVIFCIRVTFPPLMDADSNSCILLIKLVCSQITVLPG